MEIWYCDKCEVFKSRAEMQNPTKGGILLVGIMECKICGSILEPLHNADIKVNELNLLVAILGELRRMTEK